MIITFEIPQLPKTPNSIGKASIWHSHNERKKWRMLVAFALIKKVPSKPMEKANITCTRFSSREPDLDNLFSSFKFVIDAIKNCGVIKDDKSSCISLKCNWQKSKPKEGKIKVEIQEVLNA